MDISLLSQRILRIQRGIVDNANEKVIRASRAFLTEVVTGTPADTGQAISSWKTGLNYSPTGTRNLAPGEKGSSRNTAISAVLNLELPRLDRRRTGQTVYIVNTVSYIDLLNAGRSKQAPAGFIDRARLAAGAASRTKRLID
jgi:hypothetical protein